MAIARRCAGDVPRVRLAKIGAQPGGSMITRKVASAEPNSSITAFGSAAAEMVGGDLGAAYLGTQGDVWDAQKDMTLAALGAALEHHVDGDEEQHYASGDAEACKADPKRVQQWPAEQREEHQDRPGDHR